MNCIKNKRKYRKLKLLFINEINNLDKHKSKKGRPCKYNNLFYINKIMYVLITGISWNNLDMTMHNITANAIYKKFNKWCRENVFLNAYKKLYHKYKKQLDPNFFRSLFIDSIVIPNLNCCNTGYNIKIPNKKSIKLSIIVDANKIPVAEHVGPSNSVDSKLIIKPVNRLRRSIRSIKLVGDLGYLANMDVKNRLKKKKIIMVTGFRKNMKNRRNSKINKKLLLKRYVVEHAFSNIKRRFKRLSIAIDRDSNTYYQWFNIIKTTLMYEHMNK